MNTNKEINQGIYRDVSIKDIVHMHEAKSYQFTY